MCAADKVSIYDGAPIEGYLDWPPICCEHKLPYTSWTDHHNAVSSQTTHRAYSDPSWAQAFGAPNPVRPSYSQDNSDESGPLQGELRDWVEQRIAWHTGSTKLKQLRSWWSILTTNVRVPKHTHIYQTMQKTISGIVWMQGAICPLHIKVPGQEANQINNVPGRCALFSAQTEHWTDPYPHVDLRAGISFDFCIQDQKCCACVNEELCFRCIHLTKNLAKIGIDTVYTGGSTTVKTNVKLKSAIIKNPLINTLPKAYK